MGLLKSIGLLVLVAAVSLGAIGKVKPELFLKLPGPFGFLLYHDIGGKFLPPYFDNEPFVGDNMFDWVKDGDVIVATGAKTGTTWLCYCVDAIRRKGSDEIGLPYADIMLTTPWMEMSTRPGEKWADRKELCNTTVLPDRTNLPDYWDNEAFPFRVFKSHFLPVGSGDPYQSVLPIKKAPKVKFISSVRNPDDYIKSIFNFFPNHHPNFAKMWGGFPPTYADLAAVVKDHLPGQPLEGLYLNFNKAWWTARGEANVLLLHYTDMVKDLDGLVTKVAAFVGVELTPAQKEAVKEKCSYRHMNEHADRFNYRLLFGSDIVADTPTLMRPKAFTAKDARGSAAKLSGESQQLWSHHLDKELDPDLLKWLRTGGERP